MMVDATDDRRPARSRRAGRAAVMGVTGLAVLALASGCMGSRSTASPPAQTTVTATATVSAVTSSPSSESPTPTDTGSTDAAGVTASPDASTDASSSAQPGGSGAVYLHDLTPVSGTLDSGAYEVNGKLLANSVRTTIGRYSDPSEVDYLLARRCTRMTATLGLDDQQTDTTPAVASILVDGKAVLTKKIAYGASVPVDLNITNALRVTIRTQWLESEQSSESVYMIWGDAAVQCTGDLPTPTS
ncbi:hypothetical protein C0Z11_02305 [Acidipropionibacterium jensenii]|uniref:NPCBM/NEW2 domain-containing protein n=1 Tax=Acidipropionibacterium jensenii TaxID=1749 RepID=UPI000BC2E919|nr:NPCBM/NEW2 domain-containing protein [Acidipropionibacterium jensenii]AZZ41310.1 hypothetical protein C0Z11_02305 [Acidipropionibacterium jensenii]